MLQRKLPPGRVKRYCSIQSCINFKGSSTGEYVFFRLVEIEIFSDKIIFTFECVNVYRPPPDKYTHDKWKEAIGEYQQIRHISCICELHFKPQDVIRFDNNKSKRRKLKTGSIPAIFTAQP